MLSGIQRDIIHEIGNTLGIAILESDSSRVVELLQSSRILLDQLYQAEASESGHKATVTLRGRKIQIFAETPKPDVPPEDVSVHILNCAREDCGCAFPLDAHAAEGEMPNSRAFHSQACRKEQNRLDKKRRDAGVGR